MQIRVGKPVKKEDGNFAGLRSPWECGGKTTDKKDLILVSTDLPTSWILSNFQEVKKKLWADADTQRAVTHIAIKLGIAH